MSHQLSKSQIGTVPPLVSIIICTRNRVDNLYGTLKNICSLVSEEPIPTELIVVDNSSSDGTQGAISSLVTDYDFIRTYIEPREGLSHARNLGISKAQGQVMLFTDDDVRPDMNWVSGMSAPILSGKYDAVSGGIRLANHLRRPWMKPVHYLWLASTEFWDSSFPIELIGANMAFGRHVIEKIPSFDSALGAGKIGFGEDTLFSRQMIIAGFQTMQAHDVSVVHIPDMSRLSRKSLLDSAKRRGRFMGYVARHWEHDCGSANMREMAQNLRYLVHGRLKKRHEIENEVAPPWELNLVSQIHLATSLQIEFRRPAVYDRFGLVQRSLPCTKISI